MLTFLSLFRNLHAAVAAGTFREVHDVVTVGDQLRVWQFKLKARTSFKEILRLSGREGSS